MKKILGLDLGVGSIGWAVIEAKENNVPQKILGMGSRIVPLSTDDASEFSTGNAISKNAKRTEKRTARKGYDRYQLRRKNLTEELRKLKMLPDESLIKLPTLQLWQLRANAATKGCKLTLPEIGRILYHINQKRGYKHAKSDENADTKQKAYVADVNARYAMIQERNQTIGQYFAEELKKSETSTGNGVFYTYRTKEQVFPRKAYEAEFDKIMVVQKEFYPEILTDDEIDKLRNEIIFYQRGLKSCKHLVSICEFEKRAYTNKDGKIVYNGPKVAPKSSPIFQVCKIWESVNNLTLKNRKGESLEILKKQRQAMFDFLDNHDKMGLTDMYKILGISKADGWWGGKAIGKGLQGNTTKTALRNALANIDNSEELLKFKLENIDSGLVDEETGEVIQIVSPAFEKEPLYQLWHTVYSISDKEELSHALRNKFGITDEDTINKIYSLDFVKPGFGNKSAKAIRRILPYLQEGLMYSEACEYAGFRHSESLTVAENNARELLNKLPQIQKNELRQPIVEKILNQMINVVNALIDKYDGIDEIRVELARELKQSKDERAATDKNMRAKERENKSISEKIEEFGIRTSRSRIQKYRMWVESQEKCFYCGQPVNAQEFLSGLDVEIEHIIPKSLLFDDSFSNKVCACRKCNAEKGNKTAYDYMKTKGDACFNEYLERIENYFKAGSISKTKRDRLLTPNDKIPTDFIERDLRLSQYIARKSTEILRQVCRTVNTTTGSVTDFVRHTWGYDEILHSLNFSRYQQAGLTEMHEFEHQGQKHTEERIKDWSKRLDHRHHAIDALVVAMTQQSFIQRLNHLNTERDAMFQEVEKQKDDWKNDYSLLQEWLNERPHFQIQDVQKEVDKILVSFKAGKRVATIGKRTKYVNGKKQVLQDNIIIPRGALSEESVYGCIKSIEKNKPLKYIFENPDLIAKKYIRDLVKQRIAENDGNAKSALASLKKNPIMVSKNRDIELQYATCFKKEYVIKYPLSSIKAGDVENIIDSHIRDLVTNRLKENGNNEKTAFSTPLYADANNTIQIKSVRCYTGLSAIAPVKYDGQGNAIGFVKPGNNHHIAIYKDSEGKMQEHLVTFWHAVERKKYGIPAIITNPKETWDNIIANKELPESFLSNLPDINWTFVTSLQQNEMFILGMDEESYQDAINANDYATLNKYLFRIQSLSSNDYWFRYHIETINDKSENAKNIRKYYRTKSLGAFLSLYPHKIQISLLGEII